MTLHKNATYQLYVDLVFGWTAPRNDKNSTANLC